MLGLRRSKQAASGKPRQNMVYVALTGICTILTRDLPMADGCGRLLECRHPARQSSAQERTKMIQRITVNLLLKSVILTLSAAIVVVLAFGAWNSWNRQIAVKRIAGVVEASA